MMRLEPEGKSRPMTAIGFSSFFLFARDKSRPDLTPQWKQEDSGG
jgi:hypothetical protein